MKKVAIIKALRSPIGVYKKTFVDYDMIDFSSRIVKKLIEDSKIDKNLIDEIIVGMVLQADRGQNIARQIGIKSNLDEKVPAYTVNMVCGSGMKAVTLGANSIISGENKCVIVGGVEFMSNAKYMLEDGLTDAFYGYHMGITAENIAEKYMLSREELDKFSLNSTKKAIKAINEGRFNDEIVAIDSINTDMFVRFNQSMEKLSSLKPAFKEGGVITAGNTTGVNDGAAFALLMDYDMAKSLKLEILGVILAYASSGNNPEYMGLGPIYSTRKLLEKENINIEDIELFEINEAFAAQSIAVIKELNIDFDKVNVNGGAIALGHPIGASGTRIIVSLLHEMKKRNLKKGLATLCVGGGQGVSILIGRE